MSRDDAPGVDYLSRADVARELGISVRLVARLIDRGDLAEGRSYPGVRKRFRRGDVLALKRRYEAGSAPSGAD